MDWSTIVTNKRTGDRGVSDDQNRTDYQRDFDRIIFSSGFRRLQDKTQVFPLPGATFVHNRLTHSLEVSSVGRSLGKEVGKKLAASEGFKKAYSKNIVHFYQHELQNVIASACLAHDIGNPAFGHSGEKAISSFFSDNEHTAVSGKPLRSYFTIEEWEDLTHFEGNANGLRILTHRFNGKSSGGLLLTYTTLSSLIKYPCESVAVNSDRTHRKKYGCFQTEKTLFSDINVTLEIPCESKSPLVYARHPFVYLTEVADDICYRIIDFEDAHRLGIISTSDVKKHFLNIIGELKSTEFEKTNKRFNDISDKNEGIAYLRAKCINFLSEKAVDVFMENAADIIKGKFDSSILDAIRDECPAIKALEDETFERIYHHGSVVEIEIAGNNIMKTLLNLFLPAVLGNGDNSGIKKVTGLIPLQFRSTREESYERVMALLDFISGMTDPFATEMYRKITGIEISRHL